MNTRQHCFTRMLIFIAAGLVCGAVYRPEMAWLPATFCVVAALANMIAGLQVQS